MRSYLTLLLTPNIHVQHIPDMPYGLIHEMEILEEQFLEGNLHSLWGSLMARSRVTNSEEWDKEDNWKE